MQQYSSGSPATATQQYANSYNSKSYQYVCNNQASKQNGQKCLSYQQTTYAKSSSDQPGYTAVTHQQISGTGLPKSGYTSLTQRRTFTSPGQQTNRRDVVKYP